MYLTLSEISKQYGLQIIGDPEVRVSSVNDIESASEAQLAFISNSKQIEMAARSKAAGFLINPALPLAALNGRNLLLTRNPRLIYAKLQSILCKTEYNYFGIHQKAFCEDSAIVNGKVAIYPFVYVGKKTVIEEGVVIYPNSFIGDNSIIKKGTVIHSGCSIYNDCEVGENCIINSGTVIGSEGFGFVKDGMANVKVPQIGRVIIGNDCELGANNTIDRATFGGTEIGNNVKTDNQVHIGHNCKIGDHTLIVACSGIAGSTVFGKNVLMAGSSGVIDHLNIGDNSIIGTHSIVTRDMPSGQVWTGYPAFDHKEWLRVSALLPKLPELAKKIKKIESILQIDKIKNEE